MEELANEKNHRSLLRHGENLTRHRKWLQSVLAGCADKIAYTTAKWILNVARSQKDNLQNFNFISRHYSVRGKKEILNQLNGVGVPLCDNLLAPALEYRRLLMESAGAEINSMVRALSGIPVPPAPGRPGC